MKRGELAGGAVVGEESSVSFTVDLVLKYTAVGGDQGEERHSGSEGESHVRLCGLVKIKVCERGVKRLKSAGLPRGKKKGEAP